MLDLILGYLIIIIILFSANIGLFSANYKLNDLKSTAIFLVMGIFLFIAVNISHLFSFNLSDYLTYIFILIAIIIFIIMFLYLKINKLNASAVITIILYYMSSLILASQIADESFLFNSLLLTIISIVIMIVAFQSSKLLMYAKRPYNVIIGEYMSLEGILIFLLGLTNGSVMHLDYEMFSSFLILTPTYQLIYVIIGIIAVLIIGLYLNDKKI